MIWIVQNEIAGPLAGYYFFKVGEFDGTIQGDQFSGIFQGHDLAVVGIGKPYPLFFVDRVLGTGKQVEKFDETQPDRSEAFNQRVLTRAYADIKICPAPVNIAMQPVNISLNTGAGLSLSATGERNRLRVPKVVGLILPSLFASPGTVNKDELHP